jgi:hypothetical protein
MLNPKCSFGTGMDWAIERLLVMTSTEIKIDLIRDMAVVCAM